MSARVAVFLMPPAVAVEAAPESLLRRASGLASLAVAFAFAEVAATSPTLPAPRSTAVPTLPVPSTVSVPTLPAPRSLRPTLPAPKGAR